MEGTTTTPFGNRIQLCCEHGYLLKVSDDGEVSGTQEQSDPYTHLELSSGKDIGTVKIKGIQSELYICFNENGMLQGKQDDTESPGTTFREEFYGSYSSYENTDYPGWLLGISKSGQAKNGRRTQVGKKSTKFLPIRIE